MADYIPRGDAQFGGWAKQYVEAVSEYFQAQGLDDPMLLRLQTAYATWTLRFTQHNAAQNAARGAKENKVEARRALEDAVRPVTNFVQSYPATTDADRATIGISIRPPSGPPSTAPRTAPQATVQSPARLTHELRLVDTATPTRSKKPRGVLGAEVWVKFVEPGTGQLGRGIGDQALGISEDQRSAPPSAPMPNAQCPIPNASLLLPHHDHPPNSPRRVQARRRRKNCGLYGPLGQHTRRKGTVERRRDGDGGGVMNCD